MPRLPSIPSAYEGRSRAQETQRFINLFPELATAPGSKNIAALVATPGLRLFSGGVAAPVRGALTGPDGLLYVVESNRLLQVAADGTPSAPLGTLTTSSGRVSMSQNGLLSAGIGGNQIAIADGANLYIYNVVTQVWSTVVSTAPVQATATPTVTGGVITSVALASGGTGYVSTPSVYVTDTYGTGASVSITMTPAGIGSTYVHKSTGSYNYGINPAAAFTIADVGSGTGATVSATLDDDGSGLGTKKLVSLAVTAAGTGYSQPSLVITPTPTGPPVVDILTLPTAIGSITLSSGGSKYVNPQIVFYTGGGPGSGAAAVPTTTPSVISTVAVTNAGNGYLDMPSVTITDATGSGAQITPTLVGMTVTLALTSGGTGYSASPVITISAPQGTTAPPNPQQVEFIDSYFIVTNGSMSAYSSSIYDGTIFPTLATTPVEAAPDNISNLLNLHQQLFFIKQYSSEVYYNNQQSTAVGFPYSRLGGAVIDYGTLAPWTVCRGNNSALFLAWERDSNNSPCFAGVVELNGYVPTVVSPPSITWMIQQSSDLTQCFAYCYSDEGHTFYVLTNPVDGWTLVYDTTNQLWHERSSNVTVTSRVQRHLSNCYVKAYGMNLVGDFLSGRLYEMSTRFHTDAGLPITCVHHTQHLAEQTLDDVFIGELQIDVETGVGLDGPATPATATCTLSNGAVGSVTITYGGADYISILDQFTAILNNDGTPVQWNDGTIATGLVPSAVVQFRSRDGNGSGAAGSVQIAYGSVVGVTVDNGGSGYTQPPEVVILGQPVVAMLALSVSRDGGDTWGNEHPRKMGQPGEYRKRLVYRSLGHARDRVFQVRSSSPCKRVILGYLVEGE